MHPVLDAIATIDVCVQWGLGWRYLVSPSFRHSVHERWQRKSLFDRFGTALFAAAAFLVINAVLFAILWRVFIGPIKPIHEW